MDENYRCELIDKIGMSNGMKSDGTSADINFIGGKPVSKH